ncbi:MAG TPA: SMP-30/gluconolactonase/LRE family protein, partial [Myxococcaceae bacterium]|nr:SMP-30/gluconolactonase/LRE family protein [Myxococcaceae bacterium]
MRARLAPFAAVLLAAVGGCHGAIDRDPGAAVTDPGAPPLGNAPSPDSGAPLPDAGTTPPPAPDAGVDYSGVDPLSNVGQVERLNTETNFNFTEGPLWIAARGVVLFTDIPENRIIEFTPPDTFKLDYQAPSGNANGLALDPQGRLLACEHGNRRVSRTEAGGSVVTVAGAFEGKRLNSPNDLVVRSDGTIYFSDPPYGVDASARELDFQGVFRIAPDGSIHLVSRDMNRPNGLALSPDERTLYVSDSQEGYVRVHAVNADGTVGPPRKLFDT